jgi:hypothetical protein
VSNYSPQAAGDLLASLERDGFSLRAGNGVIYVKPAARLSADQKTAIAANRSGLLAILRDLQPLPPPAPHGLEQAIEQEVRELYAHGERLEHVSTDSRLSAHAGARILLQLSNINTRLLALCRDAEQDAEEA